MDTIVEEVEGSYTLIPSRESDYVSKIGIFAEIFPFLDVRPSIYLLPVQEREIGAEWGYYVIKNNKISAFLNIRKYPSSVTNLRSQTIIAESEESQMWRTENALDLARIYWGLVESKVELEKVFGGKEGIIFLEKLTLLIIEQEYSRYEKVKSIYVQKYRAELQVQVLLSIDEYNDELMENLLDIEYDIRKRFSCLTFTFLYPPVGNVEREDIMHPEARCIFSRQEKKLWQIM